MAKPEYHPIVKSGNALPKENFYELEAVLARNAIAIEATRGAIEAAVQRIRSETAYMGFVKRGSVTLVAGVGNVADTLVTASTLVEYWVFTPGGTQGFLSYANAAGAGFAINSTDALDTSIVQYKIVRY